ncbi:hypothetical protein TYRP_009834 [Tyrophagus putrescentiae]|nr:hypothetical protein TYRP_009834 [Tyrophagus putrescentiae]
MEHGNDNLFHYHCPSCRNSYILQDRLEEHRLREHYLTTEHRCSQCSAGSGQLFANAYQLKLHREKTHSPGKLLCPEGACRLVLLPAGEPRKAHNSFSQPPAPHPPMPRLSEGLRHWAKLASSHQEQMHSASRRAYACAQCPKSAQVALQPPSPPGSPRQDARPFQCPHCDKVYSAEVLA